MKLLTGMLISLTAGQAFAGRPPQTTVEKLDTNFVRRHDKGFFARIELGASWAYLSSSAELEVTTGVVASGQLALGATAFKRTAIHATGWVGGAAGRSHTGFGPGLTYYFDESENLFTSIALGTVVVEDGRGEDLQWALGGEALLGAYGWIGDTMSAGGSIFLGAHGLDLDVDGRLREGITLGLRVGLTYN